MLANGPGWMVQRDCCAQSSLGCALDARASSVRRPGAKPSSELVEEERRWNAQHDCDDSED